MAQSVLLDFLPLVVVILFAWGIAIIIKKTASKYPPVVSDQVYSGVGGWLLLLIFSLMLLGPLMNAGRINADLMYVESQYPSLKAISEWNTYKSATWGTFLLVSCLSFYAGFGLLKGRTIMVVKQAKIVLWLIGPVASIILGLFLPLLIFGTSDPDPEFFGSTIASVIAAAIWTAYLSKSKRVKATYGSSTRNT